MQLFSEMEIHSSPAAQCTNSLSVEFSKDLRDWISFLNRPYCLRQGVDLLVDGIDFGDIGEGGLLLLYDRVLEY